MDRFNLAKARLCSKVLNDSTKRLVLLTSDYALGISKYAKIGIGEINRRIKVLDGNFEFIEKIKSILSDKAKEKMTMDQTEILHEETIYQGGFASEKDKSIMRQFHKVDWSERLNLIDKFSEERFQYFAECLIYEERPEVLPKSIYNKIHRSFAERLTSTNKEKWETIPSCFSEIDTLRETKYKDDKDMLVLIDQYNKYIEEIQEKFENS